MAICETCDYANRPPYKSPCSECDKTMGSPFCCYEREEKPTNADRIRAMSDEELAKVLNAFTAYFEECNRGSSDVDCKDCELYKVCSLYEGNALEWLKQPWKENDNAD